MELFRITRSEFKDDLTGEGAFKYGGRWNSPGSRMLYTSSRRSLAMLEILVHWHRPIPPPDYVVVVLFIPDALVGKNLLYTIPDWRQEQQWSRQEGDSWLRDRTSLLLRVPSVVVPAESNFLLNPLHPDANSVKVVDVEPFSLDKRLFVFN
ncbi:RES family NAD+ phosphorylase [Dyadobacter sp. 32]|uniref:RES family NAD+ phosphorylase n=1 Tax=Dyadobacter sp. 32 TaxID=538966 RepID=UPI0011F067B1